MHWAAGEGYHGDDDRRQDETRLITVLCADVHG